MQNCREDSHPTGEGFGVARKQLSLQALIALELLMLATGNGHLKYETRGV